MRKSYNILLCILLIATGINSLHVAMAQYTQQRTSTSGIPAPITGIPYTVQKLVDLINTNNPNKTSEFIVPINQNSVVMNKDCWNVADQRITNLTGSKSVSYAGLKGVISRNLNTNVTLKADPTLINHLANDRRLDANTKPKYAKILLYFELEGYRFYINDPYPARIVIGRVNPAANIINKWRI